MENNNVVRGRIELIAGSMFGGKTSELIRRMDGLRGTLFQHANDTRYGSGRVTTHGKEEYRHACVIECASEITIDGVLPYAVGIDEAHFFHTEKLMEAIKSLSSRGVMVVVAGLEFDVNGERFEWFSKLARLADSLTILRARCSECGDAAPYQRCISGRIVNGGAADFVPACRKCWCIFSESSDAMEPIRELPAS